PRLDWDGLSGDPFALAMSSDTLHMAKRHNVLVGLEVMLLRYVGYRARLVEGYRIDLSPDLNEYGVGEKDSHSWVEYFDEDVGIWRRLDPYTAEEERNVRDVEVYFPDEHVPYEGEGEYRPSGLSYTFFDPNDLSKEPLQIYDEPAFTFHSASKLTREGKVRIKLNTSASRMYNIFGDDVTRYYNLKNSSDSGFLYVGGDNVYMSVSYLSPQPDVSFTSPSETKIENKKRR
ncbi:MAG: transglutaminase domain-containing protein, partial [Bacilli bacterium]|nr:transglutaminase domain-containing protein [Bacilli bacterium]